MRKIAISDIHGCAKTFKALLNKVNFSKNDVLYLCGDYVDRGPDSKGVIDLILDLRSKDYEIHCLIGNHEIMMLNAHEEEGNLRYWISNGGKQTMDSFQKDRISEIPQKYWDFLYTLDYVILENNFVFVHAGLNFHAENPLEDTTAMVWARNWYPNINYEWLGDRFIIHGHTPISQMEILTMHQELIEKKVLNIDNGCFYIKSDETGHLCAFDITNQKFYFQKNLDDMSDWFS